MFDTHYHDRDVVHLSGHQIFSLLFSIFFRSFSVCCCWWMKCENFIAEWHDKKNNRTNEKEVVKKQSHTISLRWQLKLPIEWRTEWEFSINFSTSDRTHSKEVKATSYFIKLSSPTDDKGKRLSCFSFLLFPLHEMRT